MWSKTRQVLLSKLAPSLQGRVNFIKEAFRTKKLKRWSTTYIFRVTVDGKTWFAALIYGSFVYGTSLVPTRFLQRELLSNKLFTRMNPDWSFNDDYLGSVEGAIHEYLNVLPLEKCLVYNNEFYNVLAVLDYRLGKRRLRKILDEIDNCPDFLYKWIMLRAEAEGLLKKKGEGA